jgi:hypothetical protein
MSFSAKNILRLPVFIVKWTKVMCFFSNFFVKFEELGTVFAERERVKKFQTSNIYTRSIVFAMCGFFYV